MTTEFVSTHVEQYPRFVYECPRLVNSMISSHVLPDHIYFIKCTRLLSFTNTNVISILITITLLPYGYTATLASSGISHNCYICWFRSCNVWMFDYLRDTEMEKDMASSIKHRTFCSQWNFCTDI